MLIISEGISGSSVLLSTFKKIIVDNEIKEKIIFINEMLGNNIFLN